MKMEGWGGLRLRERMGVDGVSKKGEGIGGVEDKRGLRNGGKG